MSEGSLVKQPIEWIDSNEALDDICQLLSEATLLAVDTEFMRTKTYYPIAGLIQINDGHRNILIDPTRIDDFYPLIDIFDDESIVKALHSCSEDLEVFQHAFVCLPKNILDTQVAGAMAGYDFSMGFAKMVSAALNVELPKSETRSDWLQRPLSQSQINYAALDVEYLFQLSEHVLSKLSSLGRSAWAQEECASLVANFYENQNPDTMYLRFKSAWKLKQKELAIFQKLCRWREDLAQDKNVPRNRLLKEGALFSIAKKMPRHVSQLRHFEGINERMVRQNGNHILQIVESVLEGDSGPMPAPLPKPLSSVERDLLDGLKAEVKRIADTLAIPVEVLAKKKDYEHMLFALRSGNVSLPEHFLGWRDSILSAPLRTYLEKALPSQNED